MATRTRKWAKHVHMDRGALKGWCERCPAEKRHTALRKVVREDGYGVAVRRLNFLRNVASRRSNAGLRSVATRDLRWTQKTLRPKSD